jgi:hypothetical protein
LIFAQIAGQRPMCRKLNAKFDKMDRNTQSDRTGWQSPNINLNKSFPFVRKFAAYSLQIWRKLDRLRQRRLQGSLLVFKTAGKGCAAGGLVSCSFY